MEGEYVMLMMMKRAPLLILALLTSGDGTWADPANVGLFDANGDGGLDITDAVSVLNFLFLSGPLPARGIQCLPMVGCREVCP